MQSAMQLMKAIGNIDDRYLNEALQKEQRSAPAVWRITAVAAVCAVLVMTAVGVLQSSRNRSVEEHQGAVNSTSAGVTAPSDLPLLAWQPPVIDAGEDDCFAYDSKELTNGNPWRENAGIKALPVYENLHVLNENFLVENIDLKQMEALLADYAKRLGMGSAKDYAVDYCAGADEKERFVRAIYLENDELHLEVNVWLDILIEFRQPQPLPDGCSLAADAPYDTLCRTAVALAEKYAYLTDFTNPQISVAGGDYNVYGQRVFDEIAVYDKGENLQEDILNYHFNSVRFNDDNGNLSAVYLQKTDLSKEIGMYPIISAQEAAEGLCSGKYPDAGQPAVINPADIKKAELVYETDSHSHYLMPYYKFYVQEDDSNIGNTFPGMHTYHCYRYPAADSKYLKDYVLPL